MSRKTLAETVRELARHPIVPRFLKFAVVGASSTLIDIGIFNLLYHGLGWQASGMRVLAISCGFAIGVTNGFIWNRLWTFGSPEGHAPTQYARFVLVNLVGLGIDIVAVLAAWPILRALFAESREILVAWPALRALFDDALIPTAAKVAAIPPVALWNFTAHSLWTFAPGKSNRGSVRENEGAN